MFASGMGFKSEELLVSDIYSKALSDSKFLSSLKEFDEKISDTGVSVEGMLNFTSRAADGLLFEKLFSKVREVYKNWKISKLPPKEKVKYHYKVKSEKIPTGTCLILITPDSERTMCTFLGIAGKINEDDIDGK